MSFTEACGAVGRQLSSVGSGAYEGAKKVVLTAGSTTLKVIMFMKEMLGKLFEAAIVYGGKALSTTWHYTRAATTTAGRYTWVAISKAGEYSKTAGSFLLRTAKQGAIVAKENKLVAGSVVVGTAVVAALAWALGAASAKGATEQQPVDDVIEDATATPSV